MHVTVSHSALATATGWIARNLESRPTHPVEGAICLGTMHASEQGVLRASGYTCDTSTRADTPCEVHEPGRVMVSGALLAAVAKVLPDKPVELATDGTMLRINCGSSQSSLPTMDPGSFPTLPDMPDLIGELPIRELADALGQVIGAAGTDDALPVFTGVCVEITDGPLRLVTSDRYRLAVRELAWQPAITVADGEPLRLLVPVRTLHELIKGMDDDAGVVRIGASADGTVFGLTTGIRQATTRLIGEKFPDHKKQVPLSFTSAADVAVAPLVEAVKRVSVLADREGGAVLCEFTDTGQVEISSGDMEHGGGRESVPIKLTGAPIRIKLSARRFLGALTALSTPITHIELTEPQLPIVIRERQEQNEDTAGQLSNGHIQVVAPMRPAQSTANAA
ncbi:DNA polymerase III subunit beta [Kibdelosporangium aridum]|uniref:DNA polymerase III subunit beta n=1 Tax=Kibdelosporangium aridum TaxID=2030 RepID=UPI00068B7CC7